MVLLLHRILAIINPMILAREKLIIVSYRVIQMCLNKLFCLYKSIIVKITFDGYDVKNGFSISSLANISQRIKNVIMINILKNNTMFLFLLIFFK